MAQGEEHTQGRSGPRSLASGLQGAQSCTTGFSARQPTCCESDSGPLEGGGNKKGGCSRCWGDI